jgi:hypothetical protein
MRTVVWGLAVIGLAIGARSAQAAPAWCSGEGMQKPFGNAYVKDALTKTDPRDALPDLVVVSCWPDDEAKSRMKEIDAARAKWSKALDLTEADWADVGAWSMEQASSRNNTDISVDFNKKYAWTTLGPLDQFAAIVRGLPNNGSGNSYSDYTYLTDALGPKLSETGRMGYIIQACLRDNSDASVVEWAICAPDLALLDRKKMAEEIRKDTSRKGFDKMIVRIQAFFLAQRIKEMEPKWKAAKEKDPVYPKMFEIAAKTRKEWDGIWKTEAAALDLMLAMDDVRQTSSRKLKEGCFDKTWPAVKAAISKIEAKRFEGFSTDIADSWLAPAMGVVSNSPGGWLALAAYHTCTRDFGSGSDNKDSLSSTIGSVLSFLPGYRGPRLATQAAIMNAGLVLDDSSAKIDYPNIDYRSKFDGSAARGYFATVGKITVKGDKAEVAFKPKLEKQEQCASSKSTNRISMISSSGTIYYESVCLKWKNVVVDRSPDPQTVDKRYVEGLKPGMNVIIGSPMVMAAFNKGKKSPSFVAGAPVK